MRCNVSAKSKVRQLQLEPISTELESALAPAQIRPPPLHKLLSGVSGVDFPPHFYTSGVDYGSGILGGCPVHGLHGVENC